MKCCEVINKIIFAKKKMIQVINMEVEVSSNDQWINIVFHQDCSISRENASKNIDTVNLFFLNGSGR